jgi:hypothetical protein
MLKYSLDSVKMSLTPKCLLNSRKNNSCHAQLVIFVIPVTWVGADQEDSGARPTEAKS